MMPRLVFLLAICSVVPPRQYLNPLWSIFATAYITEDVDLTDFALSDDEIRQYCQWETFNATCRPDEVAVMQSARYGRMRFGRCVREDHGHVGCSADVLGHLDQKCSGRHQCVMPIPDATLHQIHACPKELMSYLEAEYGCIKGKYCSISTLRL